MPKGISYRGRLYDSVNFTFPTVGHSCAAWETVFTCRFKSPKNVTVYRPFCTNHLEKVMNWPTDEQLSDICQVIWDLISTTSLPVGDLRKCVRSAAICDAPPRGFPLSVWRDFHARNSKHYPKIYPPENNEQSRHGLPSKRSRWTPDREEMLPPPRSLLRLWSSFYLHAALSVVSYIQYIPQWAQKGIDEKFQLFEVPKYVTIHKLGTCMGS